MSIPTHLLEAGIAYLCDVEGEATRFECVYAPENGKSAGPKPWLVVFPDAVADQWRHKDQVTPLMPTTQRFVRMKGRP